MHEAIAKAIGIFNFLLKEGELSWDNNRDLYNDYNDAEIREILNLFQDQMNCTIEKINGTVYLIPNMDNDVIGFKERDVKKLFGYDKNRVDYYLAQYIILAILIKFYAGKNRNPKTRDFLLLSDLDDYISGRLVPLSMQPNVKELEESNKYNIVSIATKWKDMHTTEDKKTIRSKYGFLRKVCRFLEDQQLIEFTESEDKITTTPRLNNLILYFLNSSRKQQIEGLFRMEVDTNGRI